MEQIILIVHVILAVVLISLIMIQHGKGADAGAAFGSGASATVFGARGSASFLTKVTTALAISFFATSLLLAYLATDHVADKTPKSVVGTVVNQAEKQQKQQKDESGMEDLPGLMQNEAQPAPADSEQGAKVKDLPAVSEPEKK